MEIVYTDANNCVLTPNCALRGAFIIDQPKRMPMKRKPSEPFSKNLFLHEFDSVYMVLLLSLRE